MAINPIFFSNPNTFTPCHRGPNGRQVAMQWGTYDEEWDNSQPPDYFGQRMMMMHSYGIGEMHPERKFIETLAKLKRKRLKEGLAVTEELGRHDFIIEVELDRVTPRVWRRRRVSGGIKLSVLQDKVLSPALGWCRHYHAYMFSDFKDGAQFGNMKSEAIDMMHMLNNGHYMLDDTQYTLAQLLQSPGDECWYVYDLGDHWFHTMRLMEVLTVEASTGRCEVLDGANACPPEDSNGLPGMGNSNYRKFLDSISSPGMTRKEVKALLAAVEAPNLRPGVLFDPSHFSVEEAQEALKEAFRSKASATGGQKVWNSFNPALAYGAGMPGGMGAMGGMAGMGSMGGMGGMGGMPGGMCGMPGGMGSMGGMPGGMGGMPGGMGGMPGGMGSMGGMPGGMGGMPGGMGSMGGMPGGMGGMGSMGSFANSVLGGALGGGMMAGGNNMQGTAPAASAPTPTENVRTMFNGLGRGFFAPPASRPTATTSTSHPATTTASNTTSTSAAPAASAASARLSRAPLRPAPPGSVLGALGLCAPELQEGERVEPEGEDASVCGECGSPHDLSSCGGCLTAKFCSRECQVEAWKSWHKAQCKEIQRRQQQQQQEPTST